ncbi:hypothetical protein V6Z12_D03G139300 [Gossypium hirsutum]
MSWSLDVPFVALSTSGMLSMALQLSSIDCDVPMIPSCRDIFCICSPFFMQFKLLVSPAEVDRLALASALANLLDLCSESSTDPGLVSREVFNGSMIASILPNIRSAPSRTSSLISLLVTLSDTDSFTLQIRSTSAAEF